VPALANRRDPPPTLLMRTPEEGGLLRTARRPPAARAELLQVLMLPDLERAERIGEFWGTRRPGPSGGADRDLEEDPAAKAVRGLLREMERK
jgi:hypothetical protein